MPNVVIPYKPRNWAIPFHDSFARFAAIVIHRRGGKTTALINHLQRAATDDDWETKRLKHLAPELTDKDIMQLLRGRFYAAILPTYKQAKLVGWDMLKFFAGPIPGIKTNEQELMVTYPSGHKLSLFGADNPESFRGIGPSGLGFDEYSQHPPNIFSEVLSKALADHLGFGVFTGTIKGKNQLYKTHQAFKNDPKAFTIWQDIDVSLKTESGPTIVLLKRAIEDDKDLIKKDLMTQEEFDQEWYLSPTAAIKGAYYAKEISDLVKDGRFKAVPHDTRIPVYTFWDLGKGNKMSVVFAQKVSNEAHVIDFLEGQDNDGIQQVAAKVLNHGALSGYRYGAHFAPHDIKAVEIATGKSRLDTAKEAGIEFREVPMVSVEAGRDMVRGMLKRVWMDEAKCATLFEALSSYAREWNDKTGQFNDNEVHNWASHPSDAVRYMAVAEDKMTNEEERTSQDILTNRHERQTVADDIGI